MPSSLSIASAPFPYHRAFSSSSTKMVKPADEVISEWDELVNMTPQELKDWLGSDESAGAGWDKDDGSGETIGHESGRKIIKILEKNPKKDPEGYDDEDIAHMRKVSLVLNMNVNWRTLRW